MRCAVLLVWCLGVRAAERNPDEVMKQVTDRVLASAARIPSYTCVENVTREYYWPTASTRPRACPVLMQLRRHPTPDMVLRLAVSDRLRLDVTLTGTREIFSWVGASRFDDASIDHVVRNGPMGTGAFGGFLSVIFKQDVKRFSFVRQTKMDGRILMEYSFQVAKENSGYKVKVPDSWVYSGYRGTLLVDPETGDVVRLTVNTSELPAATGCCEISMDLDLKMAKIGDSQVLLPSRATQRYLLTTGEETENTITFAGCREYRGESTVRFTAPEPGEPDAGISRQSAPAAAFRVPAEQRFTLELTTPIASVTAAAGDVFSGKLATPLRDERRGTLARAGSLVEGRLLRVERHHLAPAFTVLVLKLESVEIAGSKVPLAAVRDGSQEPAVRQRGKQRPQIPLPLQSEKDAGAFRFAGDRAVVSKGFRSEWRTVDAAAQ
jgi:hypothetical protein